MKDSTRLSKRISFILRHSPESIGQEIDKAGWMNVQPLIKALNITKEELDSVVKNCNKQRYEYNENQTKIRARQGHSVEVDLGYKECKPPMFLYHGTSTNSLDSIFISGIKKMNRHHVHLSFDEETAKNVGGRHGSPIILRINAEEMWNNGEKFYLSNNNVWLTEYVDPKYFSILS